MKTMLTRSIVRAEAAVRDLHHRVTAGRAHAATHRSRTGRDAPPAGVPHSPLASRRQSHLARLAVAIAVTSVVVGPTWRPSSPAPPPRLAHVVADADVVAGEIVVDLVDRATASDVLALERTLGTALRPNSPHAGRSRLMVATVTPDRVRSVLAFLATHPLVEGAEPQIVYRPFAAAPPADPGYLRQWHLRAIGLEPAWRRSRGRGAIVAVVDSGLGWQKANMHVLPSDFDPSRVMSGYDFVDDDGVPEDGDGHGTHVAGTIAQATDNGVGGASVAPEATLLPLRVLTRAGGRSSDLADAIRLAADRGAHVINLSLGGASVSRVVAAAMRDAHARGVLLVCAAGNSGRDGVMFPAVSPDCLAVGAVGPGGDVAPYSTRGPEVAIAAPGGDRRHGADAGVWQTTIVRGQERFEALQGTSMAAPHVAGVAALLVSLGTTRAGDLRRQLLASARARSDAHAYGAGLLDARAAVEGAFSAQRARVATLGAAALALAGWLGARRWPRIQHAAVARRASWMLIGFAGPFAVTWTLGDAMAHLVVHSALAGVLWLTNPRLDEDGRGCARAFAAGIGLHLLAEAIAPGCVLPWGDFGNRAWLAINVAALCGASRWRRILRLSRQQPHASTPDGSIERLASRVSPDASISR